MRMAKDTGSALVQRGLLLLGLMTALVIALWAMMLRGTRQEIPTEKQRPDLLAAVVASPAPGLPGLSWVALGQFAQTLPSPAGWQVRYQAATTLARLGSTKVPFGILAEMLDEDRQMRNRRAKLQDGREVPDEAAARGTVLIALRAVTAWHKHRTAVAAVGQSDPGLRQVYAAIDRLTHSPNLVVKTEAEKTRLGLEKS
jgi:hypothetical protein